jgi:small redox-active disulfide protein 2
MKLFGKKDSDEKDKRSSEQDAAGSCCCGTDSGSTTTAVPVQKASTGGTCSVKVLGSGCAKCNTLEKSVREALAELGMDTQIEHVTDFAQIASYGVMSTPALVVDGKVVSFGRVLNKDAVVAILKKVRG